MLMRLALFSRLDKPEAIPISKPGDRAAAISLLGWKARHVEAPRWAVLENSYSGAYGQLVRTYALYSEVGRRLHPVLFGE